ncbi:MAG TPA: response regulator [Verrucomicrobiae bacterium]|nr:response regulator [Verrucomicrobiae bacterium]
MTLPRTVLVVDDDRDAVYLLQTAFQQLELPHALNIAADGTVAVEYLEGTPPYGDRVRYPLPDLMLLDVKMPRMDGFRVLDWVRQRPDLASLPVVMFSTSDRELDVEKALALGARDYLVKPGSYAQLVELVTQIEAKWLRGAGGLTGVGVHKGARHRSAGKKPA